MYDRKLVGSRQRSLSFRFILPCRERPLLAGKQPVRYLKMNSLENKVPMNDRDMMIMIMIMMIIVIIVINNA